MLAGPSVEVFCTALSITGFVPISRPLGNLLQLESATDVEQDWPVEASYYAFYQRAPPWRPCNALQSVGLCRGLYCIVLPFVMMGIFRHIDEKIRQREVLFIHHFRCPLCQGNNGKPD
jgi:hypothetical protein